METSFRPQRMPRTLAVLADHGKVHLFYSIARKGVAVASVEFVESVVSVELVALSELVNERRG